MLALNALLAFIMFSVALNLRIEDFSRVSRRRRAVFGGLFAQMIVLPALTFVLVWLLQPPPSLALGMIVVAACPGGSVSNFFSYLARGDAALSISMSAMSSLASALVTPLSIAFWGSLLPSTRQLLQTVSVDFWQLLLIVATVLVLPTFAGCSVSTTYPRVAEALRRPLAILAILVFGVFVAAALLANWTLFVTHFSSIAGLVLVHNGLAIAAGFTVATLLGLARAERRAISIEVGIQNTALGVTLIFAVFVGLGGMALIAGWWGIWHLFSGAALAAFWSSRPLPQASLAR